MNGNGTVAPMDFTATAEDQPINLCDKLPQGTALGTPSYPSDGCSSDGLRSRVKYGVKTTPESPPYSSGSYDSIKTEASGCPEDLTVGRAPAADDDDEDHDDHEDNDRMNDSEGVDPERLKAFNVSAAQQGQGTWGGSRPAGVGPALPMTCVSHRCLCVCLWMRTWTAWCPSPSSPRRRSRPSLSPAAGSSPNSRSAPVSASARTSSPAVA